jgi:hypothetical protein
MMKYYFILDRDPKSAKYMHALTVHRLYQTAEGSSSEMWNGEKWENDPALMPLGVIRKDSDYAETTEKQALAFLVGRKVKGIMEADTLKWEVLPRAGS